MHRFKPLNDFIFGKTFGEKGDEEQLLSLLNAILAKTKHKKLGVYRRPGIRRGLQPAV